MAIDRTTKLRWRRRVKQRQKQIVGIGSTADEHVDRHFFRRLGRLYEVRRFLLSWILLVVMLIGGVVVQTRALGTYYLELVPETGGIYSEGMIGTYTNANPIFASSDVDLSVSKLVFSGLVAYDKDNKLVGDLAESWSVDETGKIYNFKLREDVKWHDDTKFTAEDVAFTVRSIQNPDARSPYFASWQGIRAEVVGEHQIKFTLPAVLASFPYSLTMGILPKHKLESVAPVDLRGSLFNTVEPVGTGPFEWSDVEVHGDTAEDREQRVALVAYSDYHRGKPNLEEFIIRAFLNEDTLRTSFEEGKLNAVAGTLSTPLEGNDVTENNVPLTGAVMAFMNNSSSVLKDSAVRQALARATNREAVLSSISRSSVAVDGPLLVEHVGYDAKLAGLEYSKNAANAILDKAGWKLGSDGYRAKGGKRLTVRLNTLSNAEYASVANALQKQWHEVGVEVIVNSLSQSDLQLVMDDRGYDVLVYGIVMGPDPDQFAYWHSSQADVRSQRRLNFSDYKSKDADAALEAGRTRTDPALRTAKYVPFLQAWRKDAPAIALYRPRFIYTVYGKLYNFNPSGGFNSPVDRFGNVHEWMIRTTRAIKD